VIYFAEVTAPQKKDSEFNTLLLFTLTLNLLLRYYHAHHHYQLSDILTPSKEGSLLTVSNLCD